MAHKKAGGTTRNGRDSNPKMRGVKVFEGALVTSGGVILRQKGSHYLPGKNTSMGRDFTIFALNAGKVSFETKNKIRFDNHRFEKKYVHVTPQEVNAHVAQAA